MAPATNNARREAGGEGLTRRSFLKFLALVVALSTVTSITPLASRGLETHNPWLVVERRKKIGEEYYTGQEGRHWVMVIDLEKCIGCGACIEACSLENTQFLGATVPLGARTRIAFIKHGDQKIPFHFICQHCDPAPCVEVCPTGASIKRRDGIVVVDYELCIGCKYCMSACPYGARYVNPELEAVDKCTFCAHRVDQGLLPACVEACLVGARLFGDISDEESAVYKYLARNKAKRLIAVSGISPNVYYVYPEETKA